MVLQKNWTDCPVFFGHFVDFKDQNIMTLESMVSQISTFPKCDILNINRKFSTDIFLLNDLGVYITLVLELFGLEWKMMM